MRRWGRRLAELIQLSGLVIVLGATILTVAGACGGTSSLPVSAETGPNPLLPPVDHAFIPVVNVAPARGWRSGEKPTAAGDGTTVSAFFTGLDHPRWLYVLPNGDVLCAETNAPPKPEDGKGVRAWFVKRKMKQAGAAAPSANRIRLLRDTDGDGAADGSFVFIDGLSSPFGMALVGDDFYVADSDALLRFPYAAGARHLAGPGVKVTDLPAGPINHHWTKNVVASPDGTRLYVSVGSNSNAGENGIDKEEGRAAIWEIDPRTGQHRVFASGLRNPVGMAWTVPEHQLWTAVNERDELGNDLVPDYMTVVKDGGFYGWPYSYYGQHLDPRVKPERPDLVARALTPSYALGPHTASLGLTFSQTNALPARFQGGMFVGQHGSWNRKPRSGYKVVFVPFRAGAPAGAPIDVLTGFLDADGEARGRPVGVAVDAQGALLVADDVGNVIWRVSSTGVLSRRDGTTSSAR